MKRDEVLAMLGLSKKAGKLKAGSFAANEAVKSGKAYLVICATDASERTKKDVQNCCEFYDAPVLFYGTKEALGAAVGKEYVAEVCVVDQKLAAAVLEKHRRG